MKLLMQHGAASARAAWLSLLLACSACGMDLSLGDLTQRDQSLLDDGPGSATAATIDGTVAPALPPPGLSISLGDGQNANEAFADAGDLDGDGFGDLAVFSADGATGTQYVHVRYGGPRPSDADRAFAFDESGAKLTFTGGFAGQILLSGMFGAGDVDGDGYADLFVATAVCDGPRPGDGGYLIYGGPERLDGILDIASVGAQFSPPSGGGNGSGCSSYSFAAPGDLDGDGLSDLAFVHPGPFDGDPPARPTGEAGIYVFYGRTERFGSSTSWASADAQLSSALSGDPVREVDRILAFPAGDLDGDGRAELTVDYFAWRDVEDQRLILVPGRERFAGPIDLLAFPTQIPGATVASNGKGPGDLDGDGFDEFLVRFEDASERLLFYGAPDLLAGPLDATLAAASFGIDVGALLALGDIDGDGDAELGALRQVGNPTSTLVGWDIAVLSGTRARLSGNVSVGAEPTLAGSQIYPDMPDRYAQVAMPAGDLDGDGARDVLTLSLTLYDVAAFFDPYPMLHIHYGNRAAPGALEGPR